MVGLHTGARYCPNDPNGTDTYSPRIPPDETLRDRFAMAALAGLLAGRPGGSQILADRREYVRTAFAYANEALAEREKEPPRG